MNYSILGSLNDFIDSIPLPFHLSLRDLATTEPRLFGWILVVNFLACSAVLFLSQRLPRAARPYAGAVSALGILGHVYNAGLFVYFARVRLS